MVRRRRRRRCGTGCSRSRRTSWRRICVDRRASGRPLREGRPQDQAARQGRANHRIELVGGLSRRTAPPRAPDAFADAMREFGRWTREQGQRCSERCRTEARATIGRPSGLGDVSNAARSPWSIAGSAGRAEGVGAGSAANPAALDDNPRFVTATRRGHRGEPRRPSGRAPRRRRARG
jgi:hypothetical protein